MKKLYSLITIFVLSISLFSVKTANAQKTGSFDRTVNFSGNAAWPLSYYVPTSYSASKKYRLIIGLHGKGGNPQGYCGYTMYSLIADPSSPLYDNTIAVCPYAGGDANTDFSVPASDTGIVTLAIMDAMSQYNIDPDYVYLNGFSLGSRTALQYGLLNYWRFRGLQLWAPAIQSVAEAKNQTAYTFAYQNAKYIPITFTAGTGDGLSYAQNTAYRQVYNNRGLTLMDMIYGYNHAPSPSEYTFDCLRFIDKNATTAKSNDASIYAILTPIDDECLTSIAPKVTIQNRGNGKLLSATINYQLDNGTVNTYSWTGSLNQLCRNSVTLPSLAVAAGAHTLKVYTSQPNGSADNVSSNDALSINFNTSTTGVSPSFTQNFENHPGFAPDWRNPIGWRQMGSDTAWTWALDTTVSSFGTGKSCIHFDNAEPDNTGKKYSILTPEYNFSSSISAVLKYDYAYCPITLGGVQMNDTLAINYSTDCGKTWNNLLKKGGSALNTSGTTTFLTKEKGEFFQPTSSQWKTETINLTPLIGNAKVIIGIENRARNGNLLYLDNISLSSVTGISDPELPEVTMNVYPNPNDGLFTLELNATEKVDYVIEVKNVLGQLVYSETLNSFAGAYSKRLDLKGQGEGLFLVSLKTAKTERTRKVLVF